MTKKMAALKPTHFLWRMDGTVAVIQLNRPDRVERCRHGRC